MNHLMFYCRPGFEKDMAAEIQDKAVALECFGFSRVVDNSGFVLYECYGESDAEKLARRLPFRELIFARQMLVMFKQLSGLDLQDRITPIVEALEGMPEFGELRVETADTNEAKELSTFCRKFSVPLRQALRSAGKLSGEENDRRPVLHLFFLKNDTVWLGYSYPNNNSPYLMGIPRLRFPSDAPSRSTLKLEEAFYMFIPVEDDEYRLCSGLTAVDLGASPGGWTYQLVKRGMMVTAVDNGPMAEALMETGQVKHVMEDGFKYRPTKKNPYWLVCDMVEKPARITHLIAQWFRDGLCQEAIFNLKLPMKKRYAEVEHNLAVLKEWLTELEGDYVIQAKQLYHDREEITVHVYDERKLARRRSGAFN
ncbi:23S rRNA (cytidine(2498)-2'-O)-methyltransferase RlmM [Tolumonas osonensis]|uniref:Ribosomal RNA large subunit methyltransferase M n=1 Tax=Tolumonas osonensis TaxID=675874 RepID=A0A841G9V0_9GAMM|nr:23S rRNA (cytidine(2498)-2'-O)-methyltransferase RlmM [Tolumonas osonensis]MBB6054407.1 23S rRNA (cytidine2498-2'-O)-methyltransferase [Tolumonas osonensis]